MFSKYVAFLITLPQIWFESVVTNHKLTLSGRFGMSPVILILLFRTQLQMSDSSLTVLETPVGSPGNMILRFRRLG